MKPFASLAKALAAALVLAALTAAPAAAQEKPVMENVFFNVVWGSAFGATLGVAVAVVGAEDESAPDDVRSAAFSGATLGGLIGLGMGLFVVYQGITFDMGSSSVADRRAGPPPELVEAIVDPPFRLITAADNPLKITGFSARVVNLKF